MLLKKVQRGSLGISHDTYIHHIRKVWTSRFKYLSIYLPIVMGTTVHISLIFTVDMDQIFVMCKSFHCVRLFRFERFIEVGTS